MWLTELKECIISNWLALSVENLAEDADDDFFSHVLHNENHMFYIRCYPNETIMVMNWNADAWRRRRHERGLFFRPTMPNAILYTDS